MLLAKDVFLLVSMKLQDMGADADRRWPWAKRGASVSLVDFMNTAIRQVALVRPDATAVTEVLRLEPGQVQSLPDPGVHLCEHKAVWFLGLSRNMGDDGQTPGVPIYAVSMDALMGSDWTGVANRVANYAFDPLKDPHIYRVWPAVTDKRDVWVEASFSTDPQKIESGESVFPLAATFAGPVEHWMLYEVFSGDSSVSNMTKAQFHYNAFYESLGRKTQSDITFTTGGGA